MDLQSCPHCKTKSQHGRKLKLLVNLCGHSLCDACVDLLFMKGSGACPECNVPLRRNNYRVQLFDDPQVEKEIDIRRRVLRDYNKLEEDFDNLESYNDYLEEIETIVFNLCHNIDIIETNKRIEAYKRENRDLIIRNKNRLSRDEIELDEIIAMEQAQQKTRQQELQQFEKEQKNLQARENEALIDKLINCDDDVKSILSEFVQKSGAIRDAVIPPPKPLTEFSSGIKLGQSTSDQKSSQIPKEDDAPLYTYNEPILPLGGPSTPSITEINKSTYLKHIRAETDQEDAGGFSAKIACLRALQEARQGIECFSKKQ